MGAIFYGEDTFRIADADAQLLALVAARFNAQGEAFTVRIAGTRDELEQWLTVGPGIPFRVACNHIPTRNGSGKPYSDKIKEALDVANDGFNVVAVRRESTR